MVQVISITAKVNGVQQIARTPEEQVDLLNQIKLEDSLGVVYQEVIKRKIGNFDLSKRFTTRENVITPKENRTLSAIISWDKASFVASGQTIGDVVSAYISEEYKFIHETNENLLFNKNTGEALLEPVLDAVNNMYMVYPSETIPGEYVPKVRVLTLVEDFKDVLRETPGTSKTKYEYFQGEKFEKDSNKKTDDYQEFLTEFTQFYNRFRKEEDLKQGFVSSKQKLDKKVSEGLEIEIPA